MSSRRLNGRNDYEADALQQYLPKCVWIEEKWEINVSLVPHKLP
uniref:Uncharacterized protein n=1 Tax=Rhizophora mucronata TaxID=61149 RepID=A0A2P2QFG4_RHIMU